MLYIILIVTKSPDLYRYTHTQAKERNPSIPLKVFIKSQGNKSKKNKGIIKNCKKKQKTVYKMAISTYLWGGEFPRDSVVKNPPVM